MLIHTPTKQTFNNRKEAKLKMGTANFNKAQKNGEFIFINTLGASDIANI